MQGLHVDRPATEPAPAPPTPRRAVWPWLAGAAGLAILIAAGFWAMWATTVPSGTYDDVVAERDQALADFGDAEASRDAAQARVAGLTDEAATAGAEVERLTAALSAAQADIATAQEEAATAVADEEAMRERLIDAESSLRDAGAAIEEILEPAVALATWTIPGDEAIAGELEGAGADLSVVDRLVNELGLADSRESLRSEDPAGLAFLAALAESGPAVEAAWEAWLATPAGSIEEFAADFVLLWELQYTIAERVNEALAMTGRPVVALTARGV